MGLGMAFLRMAVCFSSKSSVSEIVDDGECVRRRTRASIAAIGIVMSGSDLSRSWYVDTMSNGADSGAIA